MKNPAIPANETERLRAVRTLNLLDTQDEERFDRITRIAKRMFGTPMAVISLLDERRKWIKSGLGVDTRSVPREHAICGHTILGDSMLVVHDTFQDERFHGNPIVVDKPNIRFYAGCPLKTVDGYNVGTLCVMDTQPRVFTEGDLQYLRDLADMVEGELSAVRLATTDELTALSNRRGFYQMASKYLQYFMRHQVPASLVFIDLNRFKQINDNFGHEAGDQALQQFASLLKTACRSSDLIARLGGDEFVLLLANTQTSQADILVQHLRRICQEYQRKMNLPYAIDFSHGVIAFDPAQPQTLKQMLSDGDAMMYAHKQALANNSLT